MSIGTRIRLFQSQTHGSLSIMIGFVFLAIIGAVGGAVDISNAMRERTIAQRDLDAALLSTFRNTEDKDLTQAQREA